MIRIISLLILSILSISAFAQNTPRCNHSAIAYKTMTSDSMDVLHYSINLDIIYLSQKNISGNTELTITPKINGLTVIKLDLLRLTIDSINFDNQSISTWNYNDTLLSFVPSTSLNVGDTVSCFVYYHGQPRKDPSGWGGFYFSNDSTFAFNMGVGMQDNPHNYGRIWYPCIDDFVDRATYDFNITVKNGNVAICNGTLETVNSGGNTKEYRWKLHNDIPTYLASVAIGPYVAVRDTFNGINGAIPIAIYVTASKVSQAQASFANLKQILTAFEQYYGPYRWERVGYVGVPFNSGAMEHVTNIAIGLGYINGALTYETLFAHELSHHWFGDLVTCSSAPDMWLNEGWAVFSESMYQEMLYGKKAYKDNMRELLFSVLKNAHHNDGSYLAVAGVPHNLTYGTTVYDKGGTVAHSIRGYLGDAKFFPMLHAYMSQKAFSDQSSIDFRDFITSNTGVNMNDFFASWVFEPGFSQFAIDSFEVTGSSAPYTVDVWMRQRLNHKPNYANSNKVPITFMGANWNRVDTIIEFSGQTGTQSFGLSFKPITVFCDLEEKLADATTDYAPIITQTGLVDYPLSYFKLDVKSISDSAQFQITHNWVAPETLGVTYPGLRISTRHYWTVNGVYPTSYDAMGAFRYYRATDLDNDIILSRYDSLIMLYRPHAGIPWQRIAFNKNGNWVVGYMEVSHLKNGEYALAAYDYNYLGIEKPAAVFEGLKLKINPNPAKGKVHFQLNDDIASYVIIYDSVGKEIAKVQMNTWMNNSEGYWNTDGQAAGQYIVIVYSIDDTAIYKSSLIIAE
jgi:aminopeptidase N